MKLSLVLTLLVAASLASYAQTTAPRMTAVDPPNGKIGDVVTVTGENLSKDTVAKVYLTDGGDGKGDILVVVMEQTATSIKFKIPAKATGRMAVMILTTAKPAQLIEQPVKIQIDDSQTLQ